MTAVTAPVPLGDLIGDQARAATLGCILMNPQNAATYAALLTEDDFPNPRHKDVLVAVKQLVASGAAPDAVAVLGQMSRNGTIRTGNTTAAVLLHDVMAAVPVPACFGAYNVVVVEQTFRRRVAEAAGRIAQAAEAESLAGMGALLVTEWQAITDAWARCSKAWEARHGS